MLASAWFFPVSCTTALGVGTSPFASRPFEVWYMFRAVPYALGIALVLRFGAGFARRRLQQAAA